MPVLRRFELQAIRLMAAGVLTEQQLHVLEELDSAKHYRYTGSGYYLTRGGRICSGSQGSKPGQLQY
jgi:hypothetical protein